MHRGTTAFTLTHDNGYTAHPKYRILKSPQLVQTLATPTFKNSVNTE